jgi:Txe/YoeB family toxin of Txe-Axe toxin-antitoxin module
VKLSITSGALEDLEAGSKTNPKVLSKIIRLIAETTRMPRTGTGKPERLKHLRSARDFAREEWPPSGAVRLMS